MKLPFYLAPNSRLNAFMSFVPKSALISNPTGSWLHFNEIDQFITPSTLGAVIAVPPKRVQKLDTTPPSGQLNTLSSGIIIIEFTDIFLPSTPGYPYPAAIAVPMTPPPAQTTVTASQTLPNHTWVNVQSSGRVAGTYTILDFTCSFKFPATAYGNAYCVFNWMDGTTQNTIGSLQSGGTNTPGDTVNFDSGIASSGGLVITSAGSFSLMVQMQVLLSNPALSATGSLLAHTAP